MSGPEFSDLRPVANGVYAPLTVLGVSPGGLNYGKIHPVTVPGADPDSFREGETLLIYLEVNFPLAEPVGTNPDLVYVSMLRILPWWLRSNVEQRTIGSPRVSGNPVGVLGGRSAPSPGGVAYPAQVDHETLGSWSIFDQDFDVADQFAVVNQNSFFQAPSGGRAQGSRNAWFPSPKRLDTLPPNWGTAPLANSLSGTSDSVLLADVWAIELPNPNSAPWNAAPWNTVPFGSSYPPAFKRNFVFPCPAFGRALGISFGVSLALLADDSPFPGDAAPNGRAPFVRIGYKSGSTHAVNQERVG